jgi:hypothetical protein
VNISSCLQLRDWLFDNFTRRAPLNLTQRLGAAILAFDLAAP